MRSDHFITVDNFSICIHSVRHFIEITSSKQSLDHDRNRGNTPGKKRERVPSPTRGVSLKSPKSESGEKSAANSSSYGTASLRLLDLLDALYSKVGRIFDKEAVTRLQSEWNALVGRAPATTKDDSQEKAEEASSEKPYCPEVDQNGAIASGRPGNDGCSLLWHVAWCPILQGKC